MFYGSAYEEAAEATRGQVAVWKDSLVPLPYHELSSGKTRDGQESLHSAQYAYLKGADSSGDKTAPDFLHGIYVDEIQMPKTLEIAERDSAGYVTKLNADGRILEGKRFGRECSWTRQTFPYRRWERSTVFCQRERVWVRPFSVWRKSPGKRRRKIQRNSGSLFS